MTSKNLLLISWLFVACSSNDDRRIKQVRLKNIPTGSFWRGSADGGNWYYLKSINNHRNIAKIAVYNDQNGNLIVDKSFMLICNADKQTFINNLKNQISSFDGNKIYFIKSDNVDCYLQPIK